MDEILKRLEGALETCLFDQLRIIADRLEDNGQVALAKAYHFLAMTQAIPMRFGDRWHWRANKLDRLPLAHQLPHQAEACLARIPQIIGFGVNEDDSLAASYLRAARALVLSWKIDIEVENAQQRELAIAQEQDARKVVDAEDGLIVSLDDQSDIPF